MNTANENSLFYFRAATVLVWAALPANALLYALAWRQLPSRMATHFDLASGPNGWMSREGSLAFSLLVATFLAVIASSVLSRVSKPDAAAWGLVFLFYGVQGTLLWAENATIEYNLYGRPIINVLPVLAVGTAAAVLVVVLALGTRRGAELPAKTVLADETHASLAFAVILGLPTVAFALLITKIPLPGLKVVLGLGMLLMLLGAAMAASGFHYSFSPAGVEIRTLGFRLRSIPAYAIKSYAIDGWKGLGGYGIRGIGRRRAYVWGNRGVRIQTSEGEVFLGHDDPQTIMRDLELITNRRGREVSPSC
jgi:Protein of unknown function (DUF1648)